MIRFACRGLAFILALGIGGSLVGCSARDQLLDEWQPVVSSDDASSDLPAGLNPEDLEDPTWPTEGTTTQVPSTTQESSSSSSSQTKTTTKRTTRPTEKVDTPEDDPQRPKEEDKYNEPTTPSSALPDVTLPVTTTQKPTTSATSATAGSSTTQSGTSTAGKPTTSTTTAATSAPPKTGWYTAGGKTYYYLNGKPLTGYQDIGKARYYFDNQGVLSSKAGIDVSTFQGTINWPAVKKDDVDFAIIRLGFRGWGQAGTLSLDSKYKDNMKGATNAQVDRGVYFFSQAITVAEAVEEAQFVLKHIQGYTLTYPIVFDTENPPNDDARTNDPRITNKLRTDMAIAFCDTIRAAGYYPVIYTGQYWLTSHMEPNRLTGKYDIWLAHYQVAKPGYSPITMWQYTDRGSVSGISGAVDRNVSLVDYAKIIRDGGWNHLS